VRRGLRLRARWAAAVDGRWLAEIERHGKILRFEQGGGGVVVWHKEVGWAAPECATVEAKKSPSGLAPEGQSRENDQNPRGAGVTTETTEIAATEA
jgi:hypothetical protein